MKSLVEFGCMAVVVAGLAVVSNAADAVFPNADGLGDLASAASWNQSPIPGADSRVVFNGSMTATALADIDFAGLVLPNVGTAITLDMRDAVAGGGPRQINLSAPIVLATRDQSLTIRGGSWNLNNQGISLYQSYGQTEAGKYVTFSDGAVVSNAKGLQTSYGSGGSGFCFRGAGTAVTCQTLQTFYDGSNARIEILDGASVTVTGTADSSLRLGYNNGHDNVLVVSNGARLVSTSSVASLCCGKYNDRLSILAGGKADIRGGWGVQFAPQSQTNALIEVDGEGSELNLGYVYYCSKSSSAGSNNLIRVTNGGVLTFPRMGLHGKSNGILVSNAAVRATSNAFVYDADVSAANTHGNYLRLQGDRPCFAQDTAEAVNARLAFGFRFVFDIPPDGYDFTGSDYTTPVTFGKWVSGDDTWDVEITPESLLAALKKMAASNVRTRRYELVRFKGGLNMSSSISEEQVRRWQSKLPADLPVGMTATLAAQGTMPVLTLDVRKVGVTVIIR